MAAEPGDGAGDQDGEWQAGVPLPAAHGRDQGRERGYYLAYKGLFGGWDVRLQPDPADEAERGAGTGGGGVWGAVLRERCQAWHHHRTPGQIERPGVEK